VTVLRHIKFAFCPQRAMFEHENLTNAAMLASYKERGVKESPSAAWFLELMMTDPVYEGQGLLDVSPHFEASSIGASVRI
jgi:hypothetical protein